MAEGGTGELGDEVGSGGEAGDADGGSSSASGDGSGAGEDSGGSDADSGADGSGGDPADPPSIDIDPSSTLDFDPSTPTAIYWPPTCPGSVTDYAYMLFRPHDEAGGGTLRFDLNEIPAGYGCTPRHAG